MSQSPAPDDDPIFTQRLRRALAEPDAPAAWVQRAQALLQPAAASAPIPVAPTFGDTLAAGARALLRQIRATLTADSAAAAPHLAHGLRAVGAAAGTGAPRHLLFSAEGRDIDLRISAADGAWRMSGQVLGPDERGELTLVGPALDQPARHTALDALGEFRIDGLAPGLYHLTLRLGDAEVVLPALDIGPAA